MESQKLENLESIFVGRETAIARDLKLNLVRLLAESSLSPDDALFALLATASSSSHEELAAFAREELASLGAAPDLMREAAESAAIMGMLNTYYRFKHLLGKDEEYRTAGLRMTALAKPALGKQRFEMLAFAISVLNGCQSCIRSHEEALKEHGVSSEAVHDLARLAAVVKGLAHLRAA